MKRPIELHVNGDRHELIIEPSRTLLEALREDLQLTGTKEVCVLGSCGACTVLVDEKPVLSCLTLAMACKDKAITTIEGLAVNGELHPLQQSFVDHGAVQCGFCTPGMILTGKAFLEKNPKPTNEEARQAIAGNLCRCTGYEQIVEAIVGVPEKAAKSRQKHTLISTEFLMPETGE